MYKRMLDLHTHTDNSPDAVHSGVVMCEYAIRKGLRGIALTDHCEIDTFYKDQGDKHLKQAYFESYKARDVFRGSLVVAIGVEIGQPSVNFSLADAILKHYKYDVVLAGLHAVAGEQDFYFLDYTKLDVDELLDRYFAELLDIARWNSFDVMAHLTYPLRYICGKYNMTVDMGKYTDVIDEILKCIAQNGKALEINTSGFRNEIGEASPTLDIVKRFFDFGGEYVTVGSDAHNCYDVGADLERGYKIAYEAGYRKSVLYQQRLPVLIDFAE